VALIFVLLLLVAEPAQTPPNGLVVADFDGEKAETKAGLALWPFCDEQLGGTSEAHATLVHPGAEKSRGAVRISFRVTDDFRAPFASMWAMVGPEALATDLSAYHGVRFYARSPNGTAFTAGIKLPETKNNRSYNATSAWLVTSAPAPAPSCLKVTIVRMHATLAKVPAASRVREATKPSATPSFCLLITGNSATAVPMPARATMISRRAPTRAPVSGPAPRM